MFDVTRVVEGAFVQTRPTDHADPETSIGQPAAVRYNRLARRSSDVGLGRGAEAGGEFSGRPLRRRPRRRRAAPARIGQGAPLHPAAQCLWSQRHGPYRLPRTHISSNVPFTKHIPFPASRMRSGGVCHCSGNVVTRWRLRRRPRVDVGADGSSFSRALCHVGRLHRGRPVFLSSTNTSRRSASGGIRLTISSYLLGIDGEMSVDTRKDGATKVCRAQPYLASSADRTIPPPVRGEGERPRSLLDLVTPREAEKCLHKVWVAARRSSGSSGW